MKTYKHVALIRFLGLLFVPVCLQSILKISVMVYYVAKSWNMPYRQTLLGQLWVKLPGEIFIVLITIYLLFFGGKACSLLNYCLPRKLPCSNSDMIIYMVRLCGIWALVMAAKYTVVFISQLSVLAGYEDKLSLGEYFLREKFLVPAINALGNFILAWYLLLHAKAILKWLCESNKWQTLRDGS